MPEFTTVSSVDPSTLVNELNTQAAGGWEVVSVVESGGQLHAILRRDGEPPAATEPDETVTPAIAEVTAPAEVVAPAEPVAVTPIESAEPVTAASSTASNATVTITHTPAGWYPDPSGRFEMRYWDGLAWTEHVSRQGQQFTDPPTA
jgi:hypothetical protein